MTLKDTRQTDLLQGSISKKMIELSLPLALTGILQQLFNAADVVVAGNFVGNTAMAALGADTALVSFFIQFFLGLSLGANVIISPVMKSHPDQIEKSVHTVLLLVLWCGFFTVALGEPIAGSLLTFTKVPKEIFHPALLYLRIYITGIPFILLYNFASVIFRSSGDTKRPLFALTISGIINIILNLIFVCILKLSIAGIAFATVLSNTISACLLLYRLKHTEQPIRLKAASLHVNKEVFFQILTIGVPAGIQNMIFALSNIIIQTTVNSLGIKVIAASLAAYSIEIIVFYIINSFGQATSTFISQNYGTGNFKRCRQITRTALIISSITALLSIAFILSLGHMLLGLMNPDPELIPFGMMRLNYIFYPYLFYTIVEVLSSSISGYGQALLPAITSLVCNCGFRMFWVFLFFPMNQSLQWLMTCYPLSWILQAVALTFLYIRLIQLINKKNHLFTA